MMEWNVRPAAELEGLVSSLRCRYGLVEWSDGILQVPGDLESAILRP
jgi:hypothetical protein